MPASVARIEANRANAARSTGPKTAEGKEASRANAYKHGLTGAGVVVAAPEAAEVERRVVAYVVELRPSGEVGRALVRLAATMSVRMERCAEREEAELAARVREAEANFIASAGVAPSEAARLREEARRLAYFDPSKEAALARKYETAAQRSFFRAIKELRTVERQAKVTPVVEPLASFSPHVTPVPVATAPRVEVAPPTPPKPLPTVERIDFSGFRGRVDVPITIGRRR